MAAGVAATRIGWREAGRERHERVGHALDELARTLRDAELADSSKLAVAAIATDAVADREPPADVWIRAAEPETAES